MRRMQALDPRECGSLTLLVLAAGMGSRFGGLKQLSPVGPSGETVLEYSVYDAIRAGFTDLVFVIRRDFEEQFRTQVGSRFERLVNVRYAFQSLDDLPAPFTLPEGRLKPWGTAHAVLAARHCVSGPFAVINADDFYGADAYRRIAAFLREPPASAPNSPARFCMVAYELGKTLSEHGTVSRGICRCDMDGNLSSIREREKIRAGASGPEALSDDVWESLSFSTPVSMNIMGFTPALFPMLMERFTQFLGQSIDRSGAECYLPEAVSNAIERRLATVKVLRSDGDWMGITYPQDREYFLHRISHKHASGEYPPSLFDRLDGH